MTLHASKYNPEFLKCFWDLASNDELTRVNSVDNILSHIKSGEKDTDFLDEVQEYTLSRLVKGLSSSRESARQGFACCLCRNIRS